MATKLPPTVIFYTGINGAGKSTLYQFHQVANEPNLGERICPDELLAQAGGDWANQADVFASGRAALQKLKSCIENRVSFNWETTLITDYVLEKMRQVKELGYEVIVNFIGVENIEQSFSRIRNRVKLGGHGVPEDVVRYRFNHQYDKIGEMFDLVDSAVFYDNSDTMQVVGAYYDGQLEFFDKAPWIQNIVKQTPKHVLLNKESFKKTN